MQQWNVPMLFDCAALYLCHVIVQGSYDSMLRRWEQASYYPTKPQCPRAAQQPDNSRPNSGKRSSLYKVNICMWHYGGKGGGGATKVLFLKATDKRANQGTGKGREMSKHSLPGASLLKQLMQFLKAKRASQASKSIDCWV